MRVLINAQMLPGVGGGTEQYLIGLVSALGCLTDGPEEYVLIGHWKDPEWLAPYLGPNQRIVRGKPDPRERLKELLGPLLPPIRMVRRLTRRFLSGRDTVPPLEVPESNGFYESLGADVVHFPFQIFVRSRIPSIYNPHDLQHLHLPHFFTEEQIAYREVGYRDACARSSAVVVASQAVKDDLVHSYGLDPAKITIIPVGAPTVLYAAPTQQLLGDVRRTYGLPERFALYPGQTWPHKNHQRLFEALEQLREQHGLRLNLVCTGRKNEFWPMLQDQLSRRNLSEQVLFIGYIGGSELRALYRLCEFVIFPSLFEGGSFPLLEAFHDGAPVTCSSIPPLQEYGGDAVLQFDPRSVDSMVHALLRLCSDPALRATLRSRGEERIRFFTWERTGRVYRALYRQVAGLSLSGEDQQLLAGDLTASMMRGEPRRDA